MNPDILTFGCRLNRAESEVIRAHLGDQAADVIVVNTCAVTAEAERQARQAIRRAHRGRPDARIVVTGCAAQVDPSAWRDLPGVSRVIGNAEKLRAESWSEAALGEPGSVGDILLDPPVPATQRPHGFTGRARAFVQVQQGCDHRCSFCIIPFGRGPSRSVPVGAVVEQVRGLLRAGYREVVLTGVDLTAYGADLPGRPRLGQLARRLLVLATGLERLRLSSVDPVEIDDEVWDLLETEPRLMPHLHLSLQSGSDLILKRMKRRHLAADASRAIARARAARPEIAIGADLIAGFPTETEAQFEATLDFVRRERLPYLHVFPYSARPQTPAARMPQVAKVVRDARAARLRAAGQAMALDFHRGLAGGEARVLLESATGGHSEHFAPVRARHGSLGARGEIVRVRLCEADADGLLAERV